MIGEDRGTHVEHTQTTTTVVTVRWPAEWTRKIRFKHKFSCHKTPARAPYAQIRSKIASAAELL